MVSDGSCSKPPLRALQRAAWAMAVLPASGPDPAPVCAMRRVVHGSFPRTPAMSEHAGAAQCGQVANRPSQLGVDCMSAIKLAQKD
eukprot:224010-Pyramimonas_sp.AAC.1